ncbi:ParB/RepB/Spo0J family partition protein [Qingshengfaniella alkalisoli]|uniref:Chromosome partitioning protein ParB n=1 Tax=Qingshengfaniella alkalisoli TaxID=2599296 RepID=A0A5B8J071_9RHOB|nr:ParB N-terminal domain-containing protein [Qingshengfaniella alkalisoli]QDY71304.1 chromosome partitioning protein ParB [Qingshengfaniella alkalisoli]
MAKRRKLTAPSVDELKSLEEGFATKPSRGPGLMVPPIAKVAGEAAALSEVGSAEERAETARDKRDAETYREAQSQGRVLAEVPTHEIVADELTRDRMGLSSEEMDELKASIATNGLRLPIEVFELSEPEGDHRYGLLSGYRRLSAIRALEAETGRQEFETIRAIIREPGSVSGAYVSMVEENEVRADLSPYERGRIAVVAAGQGAFESLEDAVNALYAVASKAKRSKIRSFARVHEELGDMLSFPESLSEKAGLRLAAALRAGYAPQLREALASGQGIDASSEWALLQPLVEDAEAADKPDKRGGRPRRQARPRQEAEGEIQLANGIMIRRVSDSKGYSIRFSGDVVNSEMIDLVMAEIRRLLEPT